jgi:hypothetical protein
LRHPSVAILGGKSDFKAAYRRVTLHGDMAERCAIILDAFALPSLRLTFGGSPCPNHYCLFSEISADLANDLLHCPDWNPSSLHSPHADKILDPIYLDTSLDFHPAKPLDISLQPDNFGKVDIFIDDGLVFTPDLGTNKFRAIQSLLLAIHVLCRPTDPAKCITREDCLSLSKLAEEGRLSDTFTVLGWDINTRLLTIALPKKKFLRWTKDLEHILSKKKVSFALFESLIGRLNHAATACPLMRYFLGRIHSTPTNWDISKKSKKVERYLSSQVLEDLKLWKQDFLPTVYKGLSLNLISFQRPSFICWSDAYPTGLGGFDHSGFAWRLKIPDEYQICVLSRNNCLEFIAAFISVWQLILSGRSSQEDCFLSLSDNSSAVGWLHKANTDYTKNLPLFLAARKFTQVLLSSNSCLYSQHIPGSSNVIADALSRRFDLSDEDLILFLRSSYPHQVPPSLKICQARPEIVSWMTYWLRKNKEMMASPKTRKTKKQEFGKGGQTMQAPSGFLKTSGSLPSYQNNEHISWELSLLPIVEGNFQDLTRETWSLQQSKRPWQNWARSLGQTWGTTPHMEMDHNPCTHYLPDSSEGCRT